MVASKPVHRDPVDQLGNRIVGLQRQIDELTRRSSTGITAPICRIQLTSDVSLPAGVEVFVQGGFSIGEDPDGLATLSTVSGTYSFVTAPMYGRYLVVSRAVFTSPAAASTYATFVALNATDSAMSVARDNKEYATHGSDGTIVTAMRPVWLNAQDQLYWGYWTYSACTLSALNQNVPTEFAIYYLGAR